MLELPFAPRSVERAFRREVEGDFAAPGAERPPSEDEVVVLFRDRVTAIPRLVRWARSLGEARASGEPGSGILESIVSRRPAGADEVAAMRAVARWIARPPLPAPPAAVAGPGGRPHWALLRLAGGTGRLPGEPPPGRTWMGEGDAMRLEEGVDDGALAAALRRAYLANAGRARVPRGGDWRDLFGADAARARELLAGRCLFLAEPGPRPRGEEPAERIARCIAPWIAHTFPEGARLAAARRAAREVGLAIAHEVPGVGALAVAYPSSRPPPADTLAFLAWAARIAEPGSAPGPAGIALAAARRPRSALSPEQARAAPRAGRIVGPLRINTGAAGRMQVDAGAGALPPP